MYVCVLAMTFNSAELTGHTIIIVTFL